MQDFVFEGIKTVRNLAEVAMILRNLGKNEYLPTILELMYLECQDLVDENCVEEKS